MIHPLDPRSPQYAELVEAGRAPNGGYPFPVVERDPLACSYESEDRYGPVSCDEPAPFTIVRSDGTGVGIRLCDRDVTNYAGHPLPFSGGGLVTFIVGRVSCSSCDLEVTYRSELDASGRCNGCRP